MLPFFLPPGLCHLDVGLETCSFIKKVTGDSTIQVNSAFHSNARFPLLTPTPGMSHKVLEEPILYTVAHSPLI